MLPADDEKSPRSHQDRAAKIAGDAKGTLDLSETLGKLYDSLCTTT
jgi:hypothetical protein